MANYMTDLELIDKYCEECREFISPFLLREITNRGLYSYINDLPYNISERKSIARARLAKAGKTFGDPEIDYIAGVIQRLAFLRTRLNQVNIADAHTLTPVLDEMRQCSNALLDYYKSNNHEV